MKRSFLTSRASTVARVLRFGDSVGFTPFALIMSSLHLATICSCRVPASDFHMTVRDVIEPNKQFALQSVQSQHAAHCMTG